MTLGSVGKYAGTGDEEMAGQELAETANSLAESSRTVSAVSLRSSPCSVHHVRGYMEN
jgi:hypothetical protein